MKNRIAVLLLALLTLSIAACTQEQEQQEQDEAQTEQTIKCSSIDVVIEEGWIFQREKFDSPVKLNFSRRKCAAFYLIDVFKSVFHGHQRGRSKEEYDKGFVRRRIQEIYSREKQPDRLHFLGWHRGPAARRWVEGAKNAVLANHDSSMVAQITINSPNSATLTLAECETEKTAVFVLGEREKDKLDEYTFMRINFSYTGRGFSEWLSCDTLEKLTEE